MSLCSTAFPCGSALTEDPLLPTEGHFTIPSIFRRHDQLRVNYRCEAGGWLQLGLLRKNFEKIPSPTPDPEREHDGYA